MREDGNGAVWGRTRVPRLEKGENLRLRREGFGEERVGTVIDMASGFREALLPLSETQSESLRQPI